MPSDDEELLGSDGDHSQEPEDPVKASKLLELQEDDDDGVQSSDDINKVMMFSLQLI